MGWNTVMLGSSRTILLVTALVTMSLVVGLGLLDLKGEEKIRVYEQNTLKGEEPSANLVSEQKGNLIRRNDYAAYRSLVADEEDIECVPAQFQSVRFPMCLYPSAEDKIVSAMVRNKGRMYEENDLRFFFSLFTSPQLGLIDIGANLGTYTLPAAHLGHKVVSVELVPRTALRLATSVARGNVSDKVVLLNAAVSNERQIYAIGQSTTNKGDSFLLDSSECEEFNRKQGFHCMDARIHSLYLDELVDVITFEEALLKIDIQGAEYAALQKASRLFEAVKIKAVLFEWVLFGRELLDPKTSRLRRTEIHKMADFFLSRNYVPHEKSGRELSSVRIEKWSYNVIFKLKENIH